MYAQLAPQVGCNNVAATAQEAGHQLGVLLHAPFYYCQSYALGEVDVSPLEMASAYGVFADHGQRAAPTPILEIVNNAGKVLVNNIKPLAADDHRLCPPTWPTTSPTSCRVSSPAGRARPPSWAGPRPARPARPATTPTPGSLATRPTLSTAVWMGNANSQATPMGEVKGVYPVFGGTWPATPGRSS